MSRMSHRKGLIMPSELQLKCFMEVAEKLSFTRAASELFITQQACSKYIAALENELHFPLFNRTTRKVYLTEDGRHLYEILIRFREEYDAAVRAGQEHYSAGDYEIKFGLMNGTSPAFLVEGIKLIKKIYPRIQFTWYYGEQHELSSKVRSNALDIALVFHEGAIARKGVSWKQLFRFHAYLLLASHLTEDKDHIPYDLLNALPFAAHLQFGLTREESIQEAKEFLNTFHLPYDHIILYDTVDDSLAAVETGESFTVSPPILQHAFYLPFLNKYPLEHTAEIGFIWNPQTSNHYTQQVVDTMIEGIQTSNKDPLLSAT